MNTKKPMTVADVLKLVAWLLTAAAVFLALICLFAIRRPIVTVGFLIVAFCLCPLSGKLFEKLKTKTKINLQIPAIILSLFVFRGSVLLNNAVIDSTNKDKTNDTLAIVTETTVPEDTTIETTTTSEITTTTAEIVTTIKETTATSEIRNEMIEVYINYEIIQSEDGKVNFIINTNLPDETVLMLTLLNESINYTGQTKVTVKDGKAESEKFGIKGNGLSDGSYNLSISMSLPSLQSDNVRKIIGEKGEYLKGDIVEWSDIGSSYVIRKDEIINLPIQNEKNMVETETVIPETTAPATKNNITSVLHGELLSVIENEINGKSVLIIKTKITSSWNNRMTISQNYFNVEDIILNQGGSKYDEIQYWAVADMMDGSESKVVAFTINKDVIDLIVQKKIPVNTLDEYATDVYILPSLLK